MLITIMNMKKYSISSDHKLADVKANIALRKGTEKNNVLRNKIRMKSEIESTYNSPISCLKREFSAVISLNCLLYNI